MKEEEKVETAQEAPTPEFSSFAALAAFKQQMVKSDKKRVEKKEKRNQEFDLQGFTSYGNDCFAVEQGVSVVAIKYQYGRERLIIYDKVTNKYKNLLKFKQQ